MDEMERRDEALEDIMKEFGEEEPELDTEAMLDKGFVEWLNGDDEPREEPVKEAFVQTEPLEETRRMDVDQIRMAAWMNSGLSQDTLSMEPVQQTPAASDLPGDTIRLDAVRDEIAGTIEKKVPGERILDEEDWNKETIHSAPFTERWEPEYEQPMGEYIPPQPIVFQPRSRLHELKKKLVEGPEKRFYELSETGVGRLQAAIFLSLLVVLISAASTAMYAFGMVQENRIRLMIFGQFMALLISGLLGSFQLIEGFADIGKKKFTLNTLLAVTFIFCCLDGVLCLHQVRVPCCAAFSLVVTMSLWNTYQRRSTEMSRMDTMRKATWLDGVTACPDYLDGKKGIVRVEGQVEDFMDHYATVGKPEKRLNLYSLIAMCIAMVIGVVACVLEAQAEGFAQGISAAVQVTAVSLLAAVPASAFISQSRPAWVLERRLHRLGTVLCGWSGVEGVSGKAVFPLAYEDLYPAEAMRLNGMKFFGSREPDAVIAYVAAVLSADESGLANMFTQLLDSRNGKHFYAYNISHYDNGGMVGVVDGETVLIGSATFMKEMDVEVPDSAKLPYGVYVAVEGELSGLFAVSYEKTQSAMAGLTTLNAYRQLECVFTSDDFMITHGFVRNKFGIKTKRFLLPEYEVRQQLRQRVPEENAQAQVMTTGKGLAPIAYGVTGARVLRSACRLGTVLHIVGGAVGLGIMLLLVVLGALELLTPANMVLYQLVWMIPALLITEWTRSI